MGMVCKITIAISCTILPIILKYWMKKRYKKKLQQLRLKNHQLDNSYYHCIFWTMENNKCREHMYQNAECEDDNCSVKNLRRILMVLRSAKKSIAMCMYHLTLKQIADELVFAQSRGVVVRIITDNVTSKMQHSKFKMLKERYGFDVRVPPYTNCYMHHKYCVIDAEDEILRKVFLGSLNLTLQGCLANFEFVVITNNPSITEQYSNEFEHLWNILGPEDIQI